MFIFFSSCNNNKLVDVNCFVMLPMLKRVLLFTAFLVLISVNPNTFFKIIESFLITTTAMPGMFHCFIYCWAYASMPAHEPALWVCAFVVAMQLIIIITATRFLILFFIFINFNQNYCAIFPCHFLCDKDKRLVM